MKLMTLLFVCCAIAIGTSAQTKTETGRQYHSDEIGWTLQIPDGWSVVTQQAREEGDKKSLKAIEKANGGAVDVSGMIHLISFKKSKFNVFAATIERMGKREPGVYEENIQEQHKLIYKVFVDRGIKLDTSSSTMIVQGFKFYAFHTTLYAPGTSEVALRQTLFRRSYKGYDFGVTISYNNEADKQVMMDAFKNSVFK